jgi:hypothetical protein
MDLMGSQRKFGDTSNVATPITPAKLAELNQSRILGKSFASTTGKKLEKSFVSHKNISFSDDGSTGNIVAINSFDSDTEV